MTRTTPQDPPSPESAGNPSPAPASRTETMTPTVASRGKGLPPTDAQRAVFAQRLTWSGWTATEVDGWTTWGATFATRKTMSELLDWFTLEKFRRATPGAEPDRDAPPKNRSVA